ncbi:hypothetical protein F3J37_01645 [Pantoea sp. Al-1710]|uniref:Uncharacterized protein n=1 Tax=Candidatus Pantoea communis TaxID=2608354 RepID=A0ABX0RJ65_9GAMM|nr:MULTISPECIES: M91 family zinc metallopeptidase [Pantoea]NIG12917.1 hypothetical protein [Pantoea sp. Cy-640]NIG17382.1 hypothetical protein [Pantoea communis]
MPRVQAPSTIVPEITISTENAAGFMNTDHALAQIGNTQSGATLLSEIVKYTKDTKKVKIYIQHTEDSHTIPVLSNKQAEKTNLSKSYHNEESLDAARKFALKKKLTKGEGASALVYWNPAEAHISFSQGYTQYSVNEGGVNRFQLANELVHAMRILKGTYTDDKTIEGSTNEEMRGLGVFQYENEPISENKIREQSGFYLRAYYPVVTNVSGNTGSNTRPGPSLR